ncbi:secreted RxLR effector protein 161-like [Quercus lobata]|uniref:secreted RxLR effector protein 161-like n=1 Tax=Quercus lobata TaxID=97700 RepID=UPI0012454B2B|nr:secreted RxLR effector protein 161-like [Quercus lobata]
MARVPYTSVVGSPMYAILCTRPDIYFAVGMVSRYQSNLGSVHWQVVKRIFRYLRGTSDLILCYQGGDLRLRGYFDVDWASDRDEHKSTTGYVFLLSGAAISWCSKKQSCIALSTMESDYIACSIATQEAVWLKSFFQSLSVTSLVDEAIKMYCDSMAAWLMLNILSIIAKANTYRLV